MSGISHFSNLWDGLGASLVEVAVHCELVGGCGEIRLQTFHKIYLYNHDVHTIAPCLTHIELIIGVGRSNVHVEHFVGVPR